MNEVSTARLYVLRALYLLIVVFVGLDVWPGLLHPAGDVDQMRSIVRSVLGTVSLLALLGIRYPLQMLPLLFVELLWKVVWLVAFGLPRWSAGTLNGGMRETWGACVISIVLFPLVIPWPYVWRHYVKQRGDRWRRAS